MQTLFSQIPAYWQQRAEQAKGLPSVGEFHPTYGYSLEDLLAVESITPPSDFAAFWDATYGETLCVDPELSLKEVEHSNQAWRCFEIEYWSWQGFRVGGWLMLPRSGDVNCAVVQGHGYGGRNEVPPGGLPGMAVLYPSARGQNRSMRAELPQLAAEHVVHGIENREGYLLRGCVADLWAAATVLKLRYPEVPLYYSGGSFGGGLGALALPSEKRFDRAFLGYPTFGNHPIRVTLPCTGSGEAVRHRYLRDPAIMETLRYYDASSAAQLIRTPTFIDVGCYDPAVPPPGQFAVFNALRASESKHRFTVHTCHHFTCRHSPEEERRTGLEVLEWFSV